MRQALCLVSDEYVQVPQAAFLPHGSLRIQTSKYYSSSLGRGKRFTLAYLVLRLTRDIVRTPFYSAVFRPRFSFYGAMISYSITSIQRLRNMPGTRSFTGHEVRFALYCGRTF